MKTKQKAPEKQRYIRKNKSTTKFSRTLVSEKWNSKVPCSDSQEPLDQRIIVDQTDTKGKGSIRSRRSTTTGSHIALATVTEGT